MNKFKKVLAAIMLMTTVLFAVGCKPSNDAPDDNGGEGGDAPTYYGTLNGHTWADLGLPSGTLWATCNIGASNPSEYGNYFAWAEVSPDRFYLWDYYDHCISSAGYPQFTKYCPNPDFGYNGYYDLLYELTPNDDAAIVNWGNGWRTPTLDDWNELRENASPSWTYENNVYGRRFTANNGRGVGIFLPAAGYRWGVELKDDMSNGYYWTNYLEYPEDAYCYTFDYHVSETRGFSRAAGMTVRAVYTPSKQ